MLTIEEKRALLEAFKEKKKKKPLYSKITQRFKRFVGRGRKFIVTIRWSDEQLKRFECIGKPGIGPYLLWMKLTDGKNRHILLRHVKWFSYLEEK